MAIVSNRSSEQGDVIIVKPEIPRVGVLTLMSFTDSIVGEDTTNYFKREFRYSKNGGLIYSEWLNLTQSNLLNIDVSKYDSLVIELRYIRVGNQGELAFNDVTINGEYESFKTPVYDKLPFKKFFEISDLKVFNWSLNVLEKLYKQGILANYIERGESDKLDSDSDFISLFNTITDIFAVLVHYSRQFEGLLTSEILLTEFIKNKGFYTCPRTGVRGFVDLAENLPTEFAKRGTRLVYKRAGTGANDLDGELLRLICYDTLDEFIFALTRRGETGWCIGHSSPCYTGTNEVMNLDKSYEFTEDVYDLSKYPLVNPNGVSLEYKSYTDKYNSSAAKIELVKNGDFNDDLANWDLTKNTFAEVITSGAFPYAKITDLSDLNGMIYQTINNNHDWELTFKAKAGTESTINVYRDREIDFIHLTNDWKEYTVLLPKQTISEPLESSTTEPLQDTRYFYITDISIKQNINEHLMMKLDANNINTGIGVDLDMDKSIIVDPSLDYEISFKVIANDTTPDLTFGVFTYGTLDNPLALFSAKDGRENNMFFENIKMNVADNCYLIRGIIYNYNHSFNSNDQLTIGKGNNLIFKDTIRKLIPIIKCNNSIKWIYDLEIKPLTLPISQGSLGARNYTYCYMKNNSDYENEDAEKIMNNKLIPYDQFLNIKWL